MDIPKALGSDLSDRTRAVNANAVNTAGAYVLCWLQQTLRAFDNPAIDAAGVFGHLRRL